MLEFVCYILPGVFFTFVVEALMRKRFSLHDFLFLAVGNVILLNFLAVGIRFFVVFFIFPDQTQLESASETAAAAAAAAYLKYIMVAGVTGLVVSVLEAFLGKHLSLRLEDSGEKVVQEK